MHQRFVIEENIKLFARCLQRDDLDQQQAVTITDLLSRARAELKAYDLRAGHAGACCEPALLLRRPTSRHEGEWVGAG